jgi:hypothetical protein
MVDPTLGANITLAWDCLEGCDVPDLAGFRLYEKTPEGTFVKGQYVQEAGPEDRSLVRVVPDRNHYIWVLTAFDTSGNESDFSESAETYVGAKPGKAVISKKINFNKIKPFFTKLFRKRHNVMVGEMLDGHGSIQDVLERAENS